MDDVQIGFIATLVVVLIGFAIGGLFGALVGLGICMVVGSLV